MYFKRLKELREKENLTQEDIAKILKTTQQQYGRYETGQREIPIHHLITLAKKYKTSIDYITNISDIK